MSAGPAVIAYDGSDLARLAIEEAGRLLAPGREALVLCVWQPFDLGFLPVDRATFNAAEIPDVHAAALRTAEAGTQLAGAAGFDARPVAVEASPVWKGIVDCAEQHDAAVIVLGSHGRSGLAGVFIGSVAGAVANHSQRTVLISHQHG